MRETLLAARGDSPDSRLKLHSRDKSDGRVRKIIDAVRDGPRVETSREPIMEPILEYI